MDELVRVRKFYELKNVNRACSVSHRKESSAEHSWSCLMLADYFLSKMKNENIDRLRVYELLMYHDVAEIEAIRSAKEDFGITPEILMVFGNPRTTKKETIRAAFLVTEMLVRKYGAIPRPHVSKDFIPGNEGWTLPQYAEQIEDMMKFPASFQSLDFTALPSPLTHSKDRIRKLATEYFLKMCELSGNTTQYVKPITPDLNLREREEASKFNLGRFDR